MAIQDKSLTIKGDQVAVLSVSIAPHGSQIVLNVSGETKDANGARVVLDVVSLTIGAGQVPAIDNLLARALIELRKGNGLEV